jgi:hypothetical protein
MDVMNHKTKMIVLLCAAVLAVGCSSNKSSTKHAKTNNKASKTQTASSATTKPSGSSYASAKPTTAPSVSAAINPLVGEWQLAIPRRQSRSASIRATDATHVTIETGNKYISGDYIVQGNYLLIVTRDEKLRTFAWKINSPDSITCVRSPDFGNGRYPFTGITLLRAPDNSATSADMDELMP